MNSRSLYSSELGSALVRRWVLLPAVLGLTCVAAGACASANSNREERPFYRNEISADAHGRKTWLDHLVEIDPGKVDAKVAPDYETHAPLRIAVLPFSDLGTANYVVDKIALTHRAKDQRDDWAWTDANRVRRALAGFLAQREFLELNLIQVDTVLREHGIDTKKKLDSLSPQQLGQWLGVDAVMYGEVTHYEAYYAALMAAWQVGAQVRLVSTSDGEQLFAATGSRYSVDLRPAFDPIDIMINSGLSLLQLRDVTLARAEEEDAREIVKRIPRSEKLENELVQEAEAQGEFGAGEAGQQYSAIPQNLY
jgi:Putative bacterial lipoprotein (DUF799)